MSNPVDSLRQQVASGESTERDFIELEGAIDSAFHISRELIAVGEPSRLDRAVVDVNELVAQLEGVLARVLGPQIRLALRLEATDAIVQAEAVQLEWVFLNLAANSRDAMPNGGNFLVHTASVDRPVGTPSRMQRFVRVTVTDTGHGLFGDARTRAFDPFFSTKEGRGRPWAHQRRDDRAELSGMAAHRKRSLRHQHPHPSSSARSHHALIAGPLHGRFPEELRRSIGQLPLVA